MAEVRLIIYCPVVPTSQDELKHLETDLGGELTSQIPQDDFYLQYDIASRRLTLQKSKSRDHGIHVDFSVDRENYKKQNISAKKDLLARAVGMAPGLKICDLTMGLASDSYKMVFLGATVTACEENEKVFSLVKNARWRALQIADGERSNVVQTEMSRFHLVHSNFTECIEKSVELFDVFYFDPMYSHERKALPKKEMQYLASVVNETSQQDIEETANLVLSRRKRIVVKRALQAKPLLQSVSPTFSIEGKMVRFDVYKLP